MIIKPHQHTTQSNRNRNSITARANLKSRCTINPNPTWINPNTHNMHR